MKFSKPVSKDFTNASQLATNAQTTASTALSNATQAIGSADGKNTNYFGTDRTTQSGKNGDLYYQTNTDKTVSMYQYNNGWQLIVSDATGNTANSDLSQAKADLQSNIDQAKTDIAAAKADISSTKSDLSQAKTDISSANSDIAQAKTDIANNKNGLAAVKQTTEENSSAIANNSNAISLVKQTATQNTSDIANAKGDISTLKQTASGISTTVAQTNTKLDSLQIGATNLLSNSGDSYIPTNPFNQPLNYQNGIVSTTISTGITAGAALVSDTYLKLTSGTQIVESLDVKGTGEVAFTFNNGNGWDQPDGPLSVVNTSDWQRFYYIRTLSSGCSNSAYIAYNLLANSGQTIYARRPKLELGNKPTDWSPAPQDVQGDISTLKQTATQNTSDISSAKGDISTLKQTATQNTSDIASAKGDISSLKQTATKNTSDIADANGNISSLQQTDSKISTTVAQTQQSLDNSGATNLVYNSEYSNNADGWNTFETCYLSSAPSDMYNGSKGLRVDISGKGADTWTQFGESKHYGVSTTTVDNANVFSFSAMFKIYGHSPEASVSVTLAFFDSNGNRIFPWTDAVADSNKNDWQKASFDGFPYTAGTVTMALQYWVHGDTMSAVVAHPIITQTSANVPYHADTANQATVVKQTSDQWSVFASNNGIFTGIAVNADGTINMDASKTTVSGDMIVDGTLDADKVKLIHLDADNISTGTLSGDMIMGGTIDANNVNFNHLDAGCISTGTLNADKIAINGSTDKVDQTTGDVPYMPWKWDSSTFVISDGFISTSATNAVAPGQSFSANTLGTYSPTYLKFTMWNPNNANDEWGRSYLDNYGLQVGIGKNTVYVTPYDIQVGNISINNSHSIYSADNGDLYFRGKDDDRQIDIHAHALKSTSLLSQKTNISPLSPEEAMDALLNTDIYKYQYISDLQRGSNEKYASLVIDDVNATPQYKADKAFITPEKDARDDGILANYSAQAIKYLYQKLSDQQKKLDTQQTEIDELKQEIKNMKEEK